MPSLLVLAAEPVLMPLELCDGTGGEAETHSSAQVTVHLVFIALLRTAKRKYFTQKLNCNKTYVILPSKCSVVTSPNATMKAIF